MVMLSLEIVRPGRIAPKIVPVHIPCRIEDHRDEMRSQFDFTTGVTGLAAPLQQSTLKNRIELTLVPPGYSDRVMPPTAEVIFGVAQVSLALMLTAVGPSGYRRMLAGRPDDNPLIKHNVTYAKRQCTTIRQGASRSS